MGAGIMQLLFFGQQDIYLKSNPSITFFKKVFNTHSNFAMESIKVDFNKTDTFIYEKTILKVKIPRHADLVSQMYLALELPEIISDNVMNFRWIPNIGEAIIDNYYVSIGGSIIDKQYGEYLHIQNALSFNANKRDVFDRMSGNVVRMTNPEQYTHSVNNMSAPHLRYRVASTYPTYTPYDLQNPGAYKPSIPTRKIFIPLTFWFNRDIGNALPLVSLQYSEVELTIELRPWIELYQLFYNKGGVLGYYAPSPNIEAHQMKNFVSNVPKTALVSDQVIDSRCYLEANYIYLDNMERSYFALKPLDYLIDQVIRVERSGLKETTVIDLVLQNPVKEIIWVCMRSDQHLKNSWFDYLDQNEKIMESAKIVFNGLDRIDDKDESYYNYVQPFQHHTGNTKDGLYLYSFAMNPEEYQPSGSVNASRINTIQLQMKTRPLPSSSSYSYDSVFYIVSHNFLRISSGLAGVVYNS